jgi:Asp/Glu/hydantoin racemase
VLPASGAQLMQSPEQAAQALAAACTQALEMPGTDAVLIGGAGLAGMGARVRALGGAPVWDCVELVRDAWALQSA